MRKSGIAGFVAVAFLCAPSASLGGITVIESLGERGGIEYLRGKLPNVVTQAGGTIECDAGDEVTGGGGAIGGNGEASHLNTSSPPSLVEDEAWIAEGRTSAPGGKTVTTWAMCGPGEVTVQESTDNASQFNSAFSCNDGTGIALSGGIRGTSGDIRLKGMFPETGIFDWVDSWQEATGATGTANSSMVCSDAYGVNRRETAVKVKPGKAGKVVVKCRRGEVVVGGGLEVRRGIIDVNNVWALATQPWDSKKDGGKLPDNGWRAKSYNDTNQKVELTAHASCVAVL